MTRAITVDGVQVLNVRLATDASGAVRVYGEYLLKSGGQVVQAKHAEVTQWLGASHQVDATTFLSAVIQAIVGVELS